MTYRQSWHELLSESVFLCLLSVAFQGSAFAQTYNGPGFDPSPVEIPNVQQSIKHPITSMDLLKLRDFHGSQISPDGKWVVFVLGQAVYESNSYRSGLFIVSTEKGSKPISLGSAGLPHWDDINQWWPESPQWSADSKYIYYRLKIAETWQVWRWRREGGAPVQVTHLEHNVQSFQIIPDGTKLALTVEKPSTIDKKQLAEHGILYDGSLQAGIPRPLLDQIAEASGIDTETWLHDLRNGHERKATEEESNAYSVQEYAPDEKLFSKQEIEEQHIFRAKISPDGKSVVYQRYLDDPSESAQLSYPLFLKSIGGGSSVALTPGVYYVAQYWWSPDSKEIYYTQYDDVGADDLRPSKLMAASAAGGKPRQVLDSPGFLFDYSVDRSGSFLACTHENTTTPAELELVDVSAGQVRTLVNVNPEFQNLLLGSAKRIDVSNKYGDHFWGHLVLPPNYEAGKRYPLIVTTYRDGDAFLRGGIGDEYPIQVFAANGFAVLNFDVGRIRNNKPGDFETAILTWQSPIEGMEAAVAKVAGMGGDPSKVGITGLSHGAEIVEYAISHTDLFQTAVASDDGGKDPYFFYLGGKAWQKIFADLGVAGWPDGEASVHWHRMSPALNAGRVHASFLANAADSEYVAGLQFFISLQQLGKPVEMFVYPNELHIKNQPKHRYEIYQRNLDWFNFWLQDKEDPDPTNAEQYKRWRELRKLQENDPHGAAQSPASP
jgi:dipeptidyl aminopeptidase/acylaminoacyl peptidase